MFGYHQHCCNVIKLTRTQRSLPRTARSVPIGTSASACRQPGKTMTGLGLLLSHPLTLLLLWFVGTTSAQLSYTVPEEQGPGSFVGNILEDSDFASRYGADVAQILEFSFLIDHEALTIEKNGGVIRTAGRLDRETVCPSPVAKCTLTADVAVTPAEYFQVINVEIMITDINDNAPRFPLGRVSKSISELAAPGARIKLPVASDPDWGSNSVQEYAWSPAGEKFRLEVTELPTGQLSISLILTDKLDREDRDTYQGTLTAFDGGTGQTRQSGSTIVTIIVEDGNDHSPRFDNETYMVSLPENSLIDSTVAQVSASDADIGDFGRITYTINSPTDPQVEQTFGINPKNGIIYLKRTPDYESRTSYTLIVEAVDGGPNSQPAQATVVVNIKDLNDNAPEITVNVLTPSGEGQISEFSPVGTFVAHVSVSDADAGVNGQFSCVLDSALFSLERLPQHTQYKIVTAVQFDRESQAQHFIRIRCGDKGLAPQTSVATVTVSVLDENDNPPTFVQSIYSVTLVENNQVDAFIVAVNATDPDIGTNAALTYELLEMSSPMPLLRIDPRTGSVYANVVFDFETQKEFNFKVLAKDHGNPPLSATATVYITIVDINDNAPFFSEPKYEFEVFENEPIGMEIGLVAASDADSEPYNQFEFSFEPSRAAKLFAVDTRTGHIRTKASLDREYEQEHLLTVLATNIHVDRTLSSSVQVRIVVRDQNDNAPHVDFPNQQNHTLHISNMVPIEYHVGLIQAHDVDEGDNARLAYSFTHNSDNSAFYIDPVTGLISTRASLQNYDTKLFEMQVLVSDHGLPPKTATATLYIVVDKSIAFAGSSDGTGGSSLLGGTNLTIVIGLAVSSAVVVVILVVAIILTRMHPRKNTTRTPKAYKNPISSLNILKSTAVKTQIPQSQSKNDQAQNNQNHAKETTYATQPSSGGNNHITAPTSNISKKEVSFNIQNETIHDCGDMNEIPTKNKLNINGKSDNFSRQSWSGPPSAAPVSPESAKCQQWFETMRPDPDTDNSSAGEASTTDSGRGPSEEGENSLGSLPPVLGPQGLAPHHRPPSVKLPPSRPSKGPSYTSSSRQARPPQTHLHRPPPPSRAEGPKPGRKKEPSHRHTRDNGSGYGHPRSAPPHKDTVAQKPYDRLSGSHYGSQGVVLAGERGDPWYGVPRGDSYPDNASTTSGSYIVDHKDLDDMIMDSPTYKSVVV